MSIVCPKTKPTIIKIFLVSFLLIVLAFGLNFLLNNQPKILAAGSGNASGSAWSQEAGWIDFNPTGGGVAVSDTGLTGYAWGDEIGWIDMEGNAGQGGVVNDENGNLTGYAWGDEVGWLNFNCQAQAGCPDNAQKVAIDSATGIFTGYAWGAEVGWLNFNCQAQAGCPDNAQKVVTSWRSNQAPSISGIPDTTAQEASLKSYDVSVYASDPDSDPLAYSIISVLIGDQSVSSAGVFTWTPGYDDAGTYNVTIQASDGFLADSDTFQIVVNNTNRAPVLSSIGNKLISESSLLTFTVTASDPDNDALTYSAVNLPLGADFDSFTQIFTWTPTFTQSGIYPDINFEVKDGALSDSELITITVNEINNAPSIPLKAPPEDADVNQEYPGLDLTWRASTDPEGGSVAYNVYYGTSAEQIVLAPSCNKISLLTCGLTSLAPLTTYYWNVLAYDSLDSPSHDKSIQVYSFTTKSAVIGPSPSYDNEPTERIIYDKRIILNPPPGFAKLKADISQEKVVPD